MKFFGGAVAAGLAGLLSIKVLIPLVAMFFGLFGMVLKFAIMMAIGYFIISMLRGRRDEVC